MILSVSRRTDIPCYFSEWFMNRIRARYALVRNPMNHAQLSRITLTPDIVDCFVFWTKDPLPLLENLGELDRLGYMYYFQFTLTPYGTEIEPNLRPKPDIISTFISLSERIGRGRVVWRYDPIILNGELDLQFHKRSFEDMCGKLAPYTDTVVISFVDGYTKLKTPLIRGITEDEIAELSYFISKSAAAHGIRAVACCENGLEKYGIERSSCIDKARIERLCGYVLELRADRNQREGCGCAESVDIGSYNTCINGCVYCYANNSLESASRRHAAHEPENELLIGVADGKVTERVCVSNKRGQISLF